MNVSLDTGPKSLYSEEQVREAAGELGLKVYDGSQQVYTEQEWKKKSETGVKTEGAAQKPAPATKPKTAAQPSGPSSPAETSKPAAKSANAPSAVVSPSVNQGKSTGTSGSTGLPQAKFKIQIAPGATLTEVGTSLEDAGVISDKTAFIQKAKAKKATKIIQPGTYLFAKGESFDSIVAQITAQ
nr:endolytic transglycosylase MltG [Paenibacillus caui]